MELGIKGRKALVVGGSRGIGRAIAEAFAHEECRVTVIARDETSLKKVFDSMGGAERGHRYIVADLMDENIPSQVADELIESDGVYDIVVQNVGGPRGIRDPLSSVDEWREVWHFNAGIAIEMNRILVPPMIEQGWGRLIHTSSISGIMLRGAAPYAAAKAFLNAYTKTLGRELAKTGVVVTAVMPGAVAFPGSYWDDHSKNNPARVDDFLRHHQAIGRMGTPQEIAHFVLMLGSELASFAQAAVVPIDGGHM